MLLRIGDHVRWLEQDETKIFIPRTGVVIATEGSMIYVRFDDNNERKWLKNNLLKLI